jgi:L-serine/L-threonine ammonia-lyase
LTLHIETPVFVADPDYSRSALPILLKMDAFQPSGSFKLRGLGLRCERDFAAGIRRFICASGGNAGFAAAYAARELGASMSIVVPESTSPEARDAIRRLGARLDVAGNSFDDAHAHARMLARSDGDASLLHPFDDPVLWEGHATLIDEVVARGHDFDCVILGVGGGGLMAGVAEGLDRHGLAHIPIIAVETFGADSLALSIEAGHVQTLPAITSIATSLGARAVAEHAFELTTKRPIIPLRVTDRDAVKACLRFADAFRVLVEPACGAALAALNVHPDIFRPFKRPLVEICGGIGVSLDRLTNWRIGP